MSLFLDVFGYDVLSLCTFWYKFGILNKFD